MKECEASCGTPEQLAKLKAVIEESRTTPGCLMHILQEAQGIYGYLPLPVQRTIAEGLNISLAEVYGVVTFYSQFSLKPKGKYRISVCLGTACYVKGSDKILEEVEENQLMCYDDDIRYMTVAVEEMIEEMTMLQGLIREVR